METLLVIIFSNYLNLNTYYYLWNRKLKHNSIYIILHQKWAANAIAYQTPILTRTEPNLMTQKTQMIPLPHTTHHCKRMFSQAAAPKARGVHLTNIKSHRNVLTYISTPTTYVKRVSNPISSRVKVFVLNYILSLPVLLFMTCH